MIQMMQNMMKILNQVNKRLDNLDDRNTGAILKQSNPYELDLPLGMSMASLIKTSTGPIFKYVTHRFVSHFLNRFYNVIIFRNKRI